MRPTALKLIGLDARYRGKKYVVVGNRIEEESSRVQYQIRRKKLFGGEEVLWVYEDDVE